MPSAGKPVTKPASKPKPPSVGYRTWVSIAVIVVVLGGSVQAFIALARLKPPPSERPRQQRVYNVEVYQADPTDVQEVISAFGTARPFRQVTLAAQVSGAIVQTHPTLKVGQEVSGPAIELPAYGEPWPTLGLNIGRYTSAADAVLGTIQLGELLVRIDARPYLERVRSARNRLVELAVQIKQLDQEQENNARLLARAKSDYDTFKVEVDRVKRLRDLDSANNSQVANAEITLRGFETSLLKYQDQEALFPLRREQLYEQRQTLRTELELAELDMLHTEVRPGFSGRISQVFVERGQYVRTGDPLVQLIDLAVLEIPLSVRLEDAAKIEHELRRGGDVPVEFSDSTTNPARWHGLIKRISPSVDELTRTVMVYAVVDNRETLNLESPLLSGSFVHARILGPVLRDAIIVPRDAIVNQSVFIVDSEEKSRRVPITVVQTLGALAVVEPRPGSAEASPADGASGSESASQHASSALAGGHVVLTNLDVLEPGADVRFRDSDIVRIEDELQKQPFSVLRVLPSETD